MFAPFISDAEFCEKVRFHSYFVSFVLELYHRHLNYITTISIMPASVRISIGSRVKGKFGPYEKITGGLLNENGKRKRRSRAMMDEGIVVKSLPNGFWRVYWPQVKKTADHGNKTLFSAGRGVLEMGGDELMQKNDPSIHLGVAEALKSHCDSIHDGGSTNSINNRTVTNPPSSILPRNRPESPNEILGHRENAAKILAEFGPPANGDNRGISTTAAAAAPQAPAAAVEVFRNLTHSEN